MSSPSWCLVSQSSLSRSISLFSFFVCSWNLLLANEDGGVEGLFHQHCFLSSVLAFLVLSSSSFLFRFVPLLGVPCSFLLLLVRVRLCLFFSSTGSVLSVFFSPPSVFSVFHPSSCFLLPLCPLHLLPLPFCWFCLFFLLFWVSFSLSFSLFFLPPVCDLSFSGFYSQRTMPFLLTINYRCNGGGERPLKKMNSASPQTAPFWC